MFAILGAAGKIGSATIRALRAADQPVRAIIRDPSNAGPFEALGCEVAIADLQDAGALARAIDGASSVQVICPTAPRATDAADDMRRSIDGVARALTDACPATVLAISDYGAQVESGTGVTMLFHELEARLGELPSRAIFLRSAEHMENWVRVFHLAAATGKLPSLHHPLGKIFPTVSAPDVGIISADLLLLDREGRARPSVVHVEGPRRYTPLDVARAMGAVLDREILAFELPQTDWHATLVGAGLSDSGAALVTELYEAHNAGRIDVEPGVGEIRRGPTELADALRALLPARAKRV